MTYDDDGNHYGFTLSDELIMIRDQVRRFMRDEVKPIEDKLPHDATHCDPADEARLRGIAEEMGLGRLNVPAEYGGQENDCMIRCIVNEEASKCRLGGYRPALGAIRRGPPNIIWRGTPEQIHKYGIPCVEGDMTGYMAITEPTGGSDPRNNIQTRAVKKGDKWILNGRKMWITYAGVSDWGVIFARSRDGEDGRPPEITAFIVEPSFPGISFEPIPVIRPLYPYEITLDNCEVPEENLLGEVGAGFGVAEQWLVAGRMPYAAGCIGMAQEALDMACGWVKQRNSQRGLLADKQAIQWMIADSETELRAARMLVYEAASASDRGENAKILASACKLFGTETAFRVVDRAIQMFGGMGVAREMPLERWLRELRIKRIGEGPSEVHRMVIARDKLKNTDGGVYFG
ncbi:MAG: acyl-CoA/acyl-ACP dehydrogenase [Rhodospirillaceae bacterium]|jgi:acyl-CoA dehydrogenase|nr:acyl-CoA/acyl-ACP dehydrogenase [Rhodospirillaceae bacterium]MBT5811444.1 acyl-CoA/acyl-ACP dehydrogenase [Rhodospirillaceae bacterium]